MERSPGEGAWQTLPSIILHYSFNRSYYCKCSLRFQTFMISIASLVLSMKSTIKLGALWQAKRGDGGSGRKVQKGGDVCKPMADSVLMWQKSSHCKTIILQLKIKKVLKAYIIYLKTMTKQRDTAINLINIIICCAIIFVTAL